MKTEKLELVLDDFIESVLKPMNANILVVGSLALCKLGFDLDDPLSPHDIDLEVIVESPSQEKMFEILSKQNNNLFFIEKCSYEGAEGRMKNVTWEHKPYIFKWQDIEVNVWVVKEFSHKYVTLNNGLKYAKVMSVIEKKVAYGRKKDNEFCKNVIEKFLSYMKF